jgi:hypothetical protein
MQKAPAQLSIGALLFLEILFVQIKRIIAKPVRVIV